jgi:uncharacterized protein (TIGR00369 family)
MTDGASVFDAFPKPSCAYTLGWELVEAQRETGTIRVAFEGRPEFCNPSGAIQGGFVAAMLDDTLGPTVLVATGGRSYCATIDLHVQFVEPARVGRLVGEGRIVRLGRTIAMLEGELTDTAGTLIAKATASARVVSTAALVRS